LLNPQMRSRVGQSGHLQEDEVLHVPETWSLRLVDGNSVGFLRILLWKGRMPRRTYLWSTFGLSAIDTVKDRFWEAHVNDLTTDAAMVGVTVFLMWIHLMFMIRRMHDRNYSGWRLIVKRIHEPQQMVWALLIVISTSAVSIWWNPRVGFVAGFMTWLIWTWIELVCLRGTKGPNQYGPDPYANWVARIDDAIPLPSESMKEETKVTAAFRWWCRRRAAARAALYIERASS
jgi:uncharacterized membrane protein YhaH (DUF805 family)